MNHRRRQEEDDNDDDYRPPPGRHSQRPGSSGTSFQIDEEVIIHSLVSASQFNGRHGTIINRDVDTGRFSVDLGHQNIIAVKPSNLHKVEPILKKGARKEEVVHATAASKKSAMMAIPANHDFAEVFPDTLTSNNPTSPSFKKEGDGIRAKVPGAVARAPSSDEGLNPLKSSKLSAQIDQPCPELFSDGIAARTEQPSSNNNYKKKKAEPNSHHSAAPLQFRHEEIKEDEVQIEEQYKSSDEAAAPGAVFISGHSGGRQVSSYDEDEEVTVSNSDVLPTLVAEVAPDTDAMVANLHAEREELQRRLERLEQNQQQQQGQPVIAESIKIEETPPTDGNRISIRVVLVVVVCLVLVTAVAVVVSLLVTRQGEGDTSDTEEETISIDLSLYGYDYVWNTTRDSFLVSPVVYPNGTVGYDDSGALYFENVPSVQECAQLCNQEGATSGSWDPNLSESSGPECYCEIFTDANTDLYCLEPCHVEPGYSFSTLPKTSYGVCEVSFCYAESIRDWCESLNFDFVACDAKPSRTDPVPTPSIPSPTIPSPTVPTPTFPSPTVPTPTFPSPSVLTPTFPSPSVATLISRTDRILSSLQDKFGFAYTSGLPCSFANTAKCEAFDWMSQADTYDLVSLPASQVVERYVVALLYYSTNGPSWTEQLDFLSSTTVCEWKNGNTGLSSKGVSCNFQSFVNDLALWGNNLQGPLPSELGVLTKVGELGFGGNKLSGTIPTEIFQLSSVVYFNLHINSFTGSIPSEIGQLTAARQILLYSTNLEGQIPSHIGNMNNLRFLSLQSNQLSGSIPSELSRPPYLYDIAIWNNFLTGTIPTSLALLQDLSSLSVGSNYLSGTIPSEFANLPKMNRLSLYNNDLVGNVDPYYCDVSTTIQVFYTDCDADNRRELQELPSDNAEVTCSCCTKCCNDIRGSCCDDGGTDCFSY